MSDLSSQMYCPNLNCTAPLNNIGSKVCAACQTPLVYRYLWAVGEAVLQASPGSLLGGRYYVKAPQVWLDTQPGLQPDFPTTELPDDVLPYLYLYPYHLHVPEVHGICQKSDELDTTGVLLLENVPLDEQGHLFPEIAQVWGQATATRQLSWLWQLFQLWAPLVEQGVSASLLVAENIRVEGWRVRLCQLFLDEVAIPKVEGESAEESLALSLADLANVWLGWMERSQNAIAQDLESFCQAMKAPDANLVDLAVRLNRLLLGQSTQLPLRMQLAGATDTGPQHDHNEDTCYPLSVDGKVEADGIVPRLAVICDGIGGHEGGEIASQMAVQTLKLQVQALLAEVADQAELMMPEMIAEQLEAIVRIINDLISHQNDAQGREARRRMGTTLVMALQIPQSVTLADGTQADNAHELYLVNVGDSRAYWITPRYCHRLTMDDDVATREVRMGRSLYREALNRPDSGALIQALGTRGSKFLRPTVQRFVVEEDGVLLLCSDGLSDNGWVEAAWEKVLGDTFRGRRSLNAAAQAWIDLANENNGHDNVSVVLMQCHVSSSLPELALPTLEKQAPSAESNDWSESSRRLLQQSAPENPAKVSVPAATRLPKLMSTLLTVVGMLVLVSAVGLVVWSQVNPTGFRQFQEKIMPKTP